MQFVLKPFKEEVKISRLANIHYFEFTPSYETAGDFHPFSELLYVESGSLKVISERYSGEVKEGELIVHGANQKHRLICSEKEATNVVIIGFECLGTSFERLSLRPIKLFLELKKMLAEIIKEARNVYLPPYDVPNLKNMKKRSSFSFGADQLIKGYLEIFLIKCLRAVEPEYHLDNKKTPVLEGDNVPQRVREIKQYLDDNFTQKINVDELSFLFRTNKTTLSKEFKFYFGKTVIDYVNELKIEYTKRALRENFGTLTKISQILNISSVHYLTALFKKHAGVSPTEYLSKIKRSLKI